MKGLLVTGTDTGVGKTTVACGLLALARRRGHRLAPFKPVETGFRLETSDARRMIDAAGPPHLPLEAVCPFPFELPLAPSIAARLAGTVLTPASVLAAAQRLAASGAPLLVEAAGGLLTPYGPAGFTAASLATSLDVDVLLVAANRLGTINHTALTVSELARRGVRLAGLILVDTTPAATPDRPFNAREIEATTGVAPLGTLRFCPPPAGPDAIASALAADVDLAPLFAGPLSGS